MKRSVGNPWKQKRINVAYTHAPNTKIRIKCRRLRGNRVVFGADEGLHGRVRWATLFSENTMNGETLIKILYFLYLYEKRGRKYCMYHMDE